MPHTFRDILYAVVLFIHLYVCFHTYTHDKRYDGDYKSVTHNKRVYYNEKTDIAFRLTTS